MGPQPSSPLTGLLVAYLHIAGEVDPEAAQDDVVDDQRAQVEPDRRGAAQQVAIVRPGLPPVYPRSVILWLMGLEAGTGRDTLSMETSIP